MSVTLAIGSDTYRMDVFPLPAVVGTNPMPLDVTLSSAKAYLCCEFDRRIYEIALSATDGAVMTEREIPDNPAAPFFRTNVGGDTDATRTGMSEDIDWDTAGNVWLTQSGASLYNGRMTNRGRIVRYNVARDEWHAYGVPWNSPTLSGLLIDGKRLWVATGDSIAPAALLVTRPATWTREQTDPTTFVQVPQDTEYGGWRRVDLPEGSWPSHPAKGADGRIYVCGYWSNAIYAVDPATLGVQTYPLPVGSTKPWQVAFDFGGGCWVTCDGSRQIAKLNPTTGAWTVDETGLGATENPHSLALYSGAWWFTAYTATTGGRIGRRTSAGVMELSPPLDGLGFPRGAAGIAIDSSGRPWVALFGSKAIGRLTKL